MPRLGREIGVVGMLAVLLWLLIAPLSAVAQGPTVLVSRVADPITPVIADYLTDGVRRAEEEGHQAFVVELDTPGGLDTSMREIIQSFLGARVPVVVYVAPQGARAASAGALITMSAHVAAMSPGTTIGAATPVNAESGETASDKVINDAAAYAESIAAQRGRNTDVAVDMVRTGRAVTADEALALGVVDLIAADLPALLDALDGRVVSVAGGTEVTLTTAQAAVVEDELGFFRSLLQVLADPTLAFLFLSIGTLAVIYELATPGMGLGGVIGAILLVLGFFALSVLPVNVAGLALLALAAALFIAEIFAPGIGVFAAGGTLALIAAGLFLFEDSAVFRVDPVVLIPAALIIGGAVILAGRLAWRARRAQPVSGPEALVGRQIAVRDVEGSTARVFVEGTWWNARSRQDSPLAEGQGVRIIALEGLTLLVEPAPDTDSREPGDTVEGTPS